MSNSYISKAAASAFNNICPGSQIIKMGDKVKSALDAIGVSGKLFHVDGIKGLNDGSYDGLSWDAPFKTIQKAVDSCGNGAGDVILVAPMASAKYTENVLIVGHQSIKIIAPFGPWTTRMRPSDATTKYPFTPAGGTACGGAAFLVCSRDVEITGFAIDGGGNYAGIYVGDGTAPALTGGGNFNAAGCRINNNLILANNDGTYGIVLQGCSDNVIIEKNQFSWWSNGGIHMSCGGSKTNQRVIIRENEFLGCKGYGVYLTNDVHYNTCVERNVFADQTAATAMTRSCLFQGGYRNYFVGNYDATVNGAIGDVTDIMSGNSEKHTMDSPVYIAES